MPKVSIIIPVYNMEKYLRKCLESVCNQTLRDIEIICVNDCSSDNSLSILQEYVSRDNRVKIINFERNRGVSAARNAGIDTALGEYIGFVDSDDFIDLGFYEKLYDATHDGADIVKGNIRSWHESGERSDFWIACSLSRNDNVRINKAYFFYFFWSAIFKRKLIVENRINFPENFIDFEDPCFVVKTVIMSNRVNVIDDVYYYYVYNCNSVTKSMDNMANKLDSFLKGIAYILEFISKTNLSAEYYIVVFMQLVCCIKSRCEMLNSIGYKNSLNDCLKDVWEQCKYPMEVNELFRKQMLILNGKRISWLRERMKKRKAEGEI